MAPFQRQRLGQARAGVEQEDQEGGELGVDRARGVDRGLRLGRREPVHELAAARALRPAQIEPDADMAQDGADR